ELRLVGDDRRHVALEALHPGLERGRGHRVAHDLCVELKRDVERRRLAVRADARVRLRARFALRAGLRRRHVALAATLAVDLRVRHGVAVRLGGRVAHAARRGVGALALARARALAGGFELAGSLAHAHAGPGALAGRVLDGAGAHAITVARTRALGG